MSQTSPTIEPEVPVPDHPPDLYSSARLAESLPDLSAIGAEQVDFFRDNGYLSVDGAFSAEAVQAASAAVDDLIDGQRADFRGVQFEARVGDKENLSVEERRVAVRKLMSFTAYDERLKIMAEDPDLLGVVAQLLGSEPHLFQEMALLKPPRIGREKPWHQDCAFFNIPFGTPVVAAWIALDEATAENGALHVIPGSNRQGPVEHFKRRDWQICDSEVDLAGDVVVPLKPGGVLFWHGLTHHGSPGNRTELRRRALQFHYRPRGVNETSTEERMQIFGGEVRGAEC